jgi:hypothetical protein
VANNKLKLTSLASLGGLGLQLNLVFGGRQEIRMTCPRFRRTLAYSGMLSLTACIQIGGTQERRLVDLNAGSREVRLHIAQQYVNDGQLAALRAAARAKFPSLTDADLTTLRLAWQLMALGDGEHVMVEVTFMPPGKNVDAKAVADYVAGLVKNDLRPKLEGVSAFLCPGAPPNKQMQRTRQG